MNNPTRPAVSAQGQMATATVRDDDAPRFAVLGRVRAWRGAAEVELGPPQQRAVLAALLLRRERLVTVAELVDAVWGDEPPAAAVSVLRTYVSRLRKALGTGARQGGSGRAGGHGAGQVVVSARDGYLAQVPRDALDLGVFEQRVEQAHQLRDQGETRAAAELLHAALDAWEGTPLAGLPGPLAGSERSRLAEQRLATVESCLEADIELGHHGEAVPALIRLTGEHPLREELCRLLVLALYRSGQQAEALATFRRMRETLVDELGVEPGAALRELHEGILTGAASRGTPQHGRAEPEPAHAPAAARPAPLPAQLPPDLPVFTGREDELRQAQALVPDITAPSPVMLIGGTGGVGKTAFAVHWAHRIAHRYPDGQLYVNLRGFGPSGSVMPPAEALRILLGALGVHPESVPDGLDARSALFRSLLAGRRTLVLLDNARESAQVRPLLPGAPGCLVIATSRSRLTGLIAHEGAQPLALRPFSHAEARAFLARRLGAACLTAEPEVTGEIIACCGRLPLALAVVAARAVSHAGLPLGAVAGELRESHGTLDALTGGEPGSDVRTVLSWSRDVLSAPAARLFRLLGLYGGRDLSLHAAAALAGASPREARRLLAEITGVHHLEEPVPGRYALHGLLRVHAAESVAAEETREEREHAVERLSSWYLHTADAVHTRLAPDRRPLPLVPPPPGCLPLEFASRDEALAWCGAERSNFVPAMRLAAAYRRPGLARRLAASLQGLSCLWGEAAERRHGAPAVREALREAGSRRGEGDAFVRLGAPLPAACGPDTVTLRDSLRSEAA